MLQATADRTTLTPSQRFNDAAADAAFGMFPRFKDDEYLKGYCHGLQHVSTNEKGELIRNPIHTEDTEV